MRDEGRLMMMVVARGRAAMATALMVAQLGVTVVGSPVGAQSVMGDAELDAWVADIESEAEEARSLLAALHSDRLHLEAVIDDAGADPSDILEWVRAETRWVPYSGALRGPHGVLMDRVGNSLDRSLLLAALLETAGHADVRLARASLDDEAAAALVANAGSIAATAPPALDPKIEALRDAVITGADDLMAAIEAGAMAPDPTTAVGHASDHWWVQVQDETGEWLDLDAARARSDTTPAPDQTYLPSELPEDLRQGLTIRVVAERLEEGGLVEEVALERQLTLGSGRPNAHLELTFDYTTDGRIQLPEDDPVLDDLVSMPFWRPALMIEDDRMEGEWVSIDGTLGIPAEPPAAGAALGEGTDLLGGLGSDDAPEPEPLPTQLTAVWIEYQTEVPGHEPRIERRELFDLLGGERDAVGPERLAALTGQDLTARGQALLGSTVMLLQASGLDVEAINEAYLRDTIDTRSGRIALAYLSAGRDDDRILPSLDATRPYPLDLLTLAAARSWMSPDPGATYLAEPNVWSTHVFFEDDGDGLVGTTATDIVLNRLAVRPHETVDPFAAAVRAGLLDTLLEYELRMPGADDNTWSLFRDGDPADWHRLTSVEELDAVGAGLPQADRIRIAESLAEGDTVLLSDVVRTQAGLDHADWWRVRPDGATLGIGYRGWGSTTENVITRDMVTEEMIRRRVQQQAIAICNRFGLAADAVNTTLIASQLLAARGMPLLPPRRSAGCVITLG